MIVGTLAKSPRELWFRRHTDEVQLDDSFDELSRLGRVLDLGSLSASGREASPGWGLFFIGGSIPVEDGSMGL